MGPSLPHARARGLYGHSLWIPPSVGWNTLDPRARRLAADVGTSTPPAPGSTSLPDCEFQLCP
ncbi:MULTISPECIES: hypothetical protein [Streptomyces]|uniref:Uncharacterized protein n=1 Tax=Streptomyces sp. 900129855 TaxID=3155129 RepID=A0ABV2ZCZ4_9ACTN